MILDRFGVRGRLALLLVLPVLAFLFVAVPFAMGQVWRAETAAATAALARKAELIGDLNWQLQHELIVTTAFLVVPAADVGPVLEQQRAAAAAAERVRGELGADGSDELVAAVARLGSLDELRRSAELHGISVESLRRTHHSVCEALIDALRLEPEAADDPAAVRDLTALEALLRADNETAQFGASLITAPERAGSTDVGGQHSAAHAEIYTQRFIRQAGPAHAQLVALAVLGDDGREVDRLTQEVARLGDNPQAVDSFRAQAVPTVERQSSMRRLVQGRVTADIAAAAAARASTAATYAALIGIGVATLLVAVVLLSTGVSRSIARPLRGLTRSAITVAEFARRDLERIADTDDPVGDTGIERELPQLTEVRTTAGGEVGELAAAFNRVQATAAAMLQRQITNRRNVSSMFADVARRTQNLVHRQLTVVDGLERHEQNPEILAGLYQIDHLSTRLRRNADKLLVVSGAADPVPMTGPAKLTTVLRSATAEIEEYQRVGLDDVDDVTLVSALGTDLVLLFAELIENATVFSPPRTKVEIRTSFRRDGACTVAVVDHGIGLPDERRVAENRRLFEPERLDVAPSGLLGLFVVGRLARRHRLRVELTETPGGGLTANVTVPAGMVVADPPAPTEVAEPVAHRAFVVGPPVDPGFGWFDDPVQAPEQVPERAEPVAAGRAGLRRRVPGAQLPEAIPLAPPPRGSERWRDPEAERADLDAFETSFALGAGTATGNVPETRPETGPARGGLSRRVPGATLAPGLRRSTDYKHADHKPAGPPAPFPRDPEAERRAFDGFVDGFTRAATPDPPDPPDPPDHQTKERQP
ncbi:sensor histidine kinase [Pseudonocardia sp. TRM90224]|uniref:sensor histidine kinase n=1 Tax=Pseudonocardia sp. TRM90224 TaxID=2812678 RepID=UPI001E4E22E9|nr:ATP-binding protein [Pseudonocardia sp. TRM90224]